MAGEGVGGLLDHKGLLVEVEVFSGALPLSFYSLVFVFQRLVLLSVHATAVAAAI